jgi:hypothetical protein
VYGWADEIIVVDGGTEKLTVTGEKIKIVKYPWPQDWSWEELPKHLNEGLKYANGDWVIRIDSDYVFKRYTREQIESELKKNESKKAVTFQKISAVFCNKFYEKGPTLMGLNTKFDIAFGRARDKYTDLCVPITDTRSSDIKGVLWGRALFSTEIGKTGIEFFNYDYTFKTKEFTKKEFFRFSMAHKKYFGYTDWGETEVASLGKFIGMMKNRKEKCVYNFDASQQPLFIRNKIENIKEEQFGYNGWGLI